MNSNDKKAQNKKSLLSIGVLMLSLAALQSPLWRSQRAAIPVAVRAGGATLLESETPIAQIAIDGNQQASAEIVGDREVLLRGKSLGEARLLIALKDGHTSTYRVVVRSESAQTSRAITPQ
ncbi:MAG TPA: pilus assembly protein N-terminal domain-containing protein [Bryobacteraceae bacterium]|jgi:hypothetical protein